MYSVVMSNQPAHLDALMHAAFQVANPIPAVWPDEDDCGLGMRKTISTRTNEMKRPTVGRWKRITMTTKWNESTAVQPVKPPDKTASLALACRATVNVNERTDKRYDHSYYFYFADSFSHDNITLDESKALALAELPAKLEAAAAEIRAMGRAAQSPVDN